MSVYSSIYVACGGDTLVNGIYHEASGDVWQHQDNTDYYISQNGFGEWEIYSLPNNTILYSLTVGSSTSPLSTTSWVTVNGTSPTVKSYTLDSSALNGTEGSIPSLVVTGAGTSSVNGTYTYQTNVLVNYSSSSNIYISAYVHSSGSYVITDYNSSVWVIQSIPSFGGVPIYTSSAIAGRMFATQLFFIDFFETGEGTATASINNSVLCDSGGTTPFLTGKYIYTKDNVNYVRGYNNQPYVR